MLSGEGGVGLVTLVLYNLGVGAGSGHFLALYNLCMAPYHFSFLILVWLQ